MKIFTIATAHLDTSWLWTQEESIKHLIKPSFEDNYKYFDKYPNYRFNFEGSYRYELLKEYYPKTFQELKKYVDNKKYNVTGSAFENGDVNIVSPESLIRNITYGNTFFFNEFGRRSNDIYLPDCFGFGKVLPSVIEHCGLKGFSTQKLTWGSQNGIPFEIGKWNGINNKSVYISIDGGPYGNILGEDIREKYKPKIDRNMKHGVDFTMVYHGAGDRGGSPREKAIVALEKAISSNKDNNIEVLASTPSELFDYIEEVDKKIKLPVFDDEFLLSTHGVGSYTSRTQMKRFNKRSEVLADISERANSLSYLNGYKYPDNRFDFGWKKVLQHHFHDDITGTSFMECYKRGYNDYVQALNIFESEYKNAVLNLSQNFNTSNIVGIPVVVFNSCQDDSSYMTSIKIDGLNGKAVKVFNSDSKEVTSQVSGDMVYFKDNFKGSTLSLYDIQIQDYTYKQKELENKKKIENDKYIISFDDNYSIESIYDKELKQELLESTIEYELIPDITFSGYPSWEIKYDDVLRKAYGYPKLQSFKVLDNGDLFTRLEIIKAYDNSTFKEIITLEKEGKRIDVFNEVDWSQEATLLKVKFNVKPNNEYASYDIGFGSYKRNNNTEKKYEVPAQRFVDIEDDSKGFGVSILNDSKTGFDKPNNNTIRLTAIHTPMYHYRHENSQHLQDFGINRFSYSIYSHSTGLHNTIIETDKFVKGIQAFRVSKHNGSYNSYNLVSINNSCVRISAIKKALEGEDLIIRVFEATGNKQTDVSIKFNNKILKAYECYGDERIINEIDNKLTFDINPYEIKTLRVKFDIDTKDLKQEFVNLDFDVCGITSNENRAQSTIKNNISLPKEMINDLVSSCSVDFKINKQDGNNVVSCKGQIVKTGYDYKFGNMLILNIGKDKEVTINDTKCLIQSSIENIGSWDLIPLNEAGYVKKIPQDYTVTHYHTPNGDEIGKNIYLYNVIVPINNGEIILPNDDDLYVFGVTLNNRENDISCLKMFDELDKRELKYKLSKYASRKSRRPKYQKFFDIFLDRRKVYKVTMPWGNTYQTLSDGYSAIDWFSNKVHERRMKKKETNS